MKKSSRFSPVNPAKEFAATMQASFVADKQEQKEKEKEEEKIWCADCKLLLQIGDHIFIPNNFRIILTSENLCLQCVSKRAEKQKLKEMLDIGGDNIPQELQNSLRAASKPRGENIYVTSEWKSQWLTVEYQSWYKRKVAKVKRRDWFERMQDNIQIEIESDMFDAQMSLKSDYGSSENLEKAKKICIINQMNKMNIPLTNFFRGL